MKLSEFKKDKILSYSFSLSGILLFISIILAYFNLSKVTNLLILHFDSYTGIDFLGNKKDVYSVLGVGFMINLINLFISLKVYFKERFLSYFISVFNTFFSILILMAVFVIISIN